MTKAQAQQLDRVERKVDCLAKALGGPLLKREFDEIRTQLGGRAVFPRRTRPSEPRVNAE